MFTETCLVCGADPLGACKSTDGRCALGKKPPPTPKLRSRPDVLEWAKSEVASWPAWKRKAMLEVLSSS